MRTVFGSKASMEWAAVDTLLCLMVGAVSTALLTNCGLVKAASCSGFIIL